MIAAWIYQTRKTVQSTLPRFDAAGNQLVIGTTAFTYDAENRKTSATNPPAYSGGTVFYRYDGKGQRVQKVMDSGITTYVYDIQGRLTAEYTNFPNPTPACRRCYLTRDHLGSTRMVTDQAANLISRHDYLPFGEEITAGNASRDSYFGRLDLSKACLPAKNGIKKRA